MKIAIDFDGVIIDHPDIPTRKDWWKDKPQSGALDAIKFLILQGHDIYILTARREIAEVYGWLLGYDFPFLHITNKKQPGTDVYIDDRAVRFTNWKDMVKLLG